MIIDHNGNGQLRKSRSAKRFDLIRVRIIFQTRRISKKRLVYQTRAFWTLTIAYGSCCFNAGATRCIRLSGAARLLSLRCQVLAAASMMPFHRNWKQSRQRHANLRRNSSNCWQCLEVPTGHLQRTRLVPVTASHENVRSLLADYPSSTVPSAMPR